MRLTGRVLVTTTYLHQESADEVRDARPPDEPVTVARVEAPAPEFARFLYATVGGDWYWLGRLGWSLDEWTRWLARPGSETWVAWQRGAPAGYVELDARPADGGTHVEIAYFGLLPASIGRGIGGHLLATGLRHAWAAADRWPGLAPTTRVWVHTCTLDGPHALANYRARGMRVYRTTDAEEDLPPTPPGPWPGAR